MRQYNNGGMRYFLDDRGGIVRRVSESLNPMAGVARDLLSGIYCPANAAQWASVLAVAGITTGGPSMLWLCQEASGNLADSIGAFTGVASGTVGYNQAEAGWTRTAVSVTDGVAGAFATTVPEGSTTSALSLAYVNVVASAGTRQAIGMHTGTNSRFNATAADRPQAVSNANTVSGVSSHQGAVRPCVLRHNVTATTAMGCNNVEKLAPAFGALAGTTFQLAGSSRLPPTMRANYVVNFHGAAAEMTDAKLKTLLQTLGWSIAW